MFWQGYLQGAFNGEGLNISLYVCRPRKRDGALQGHAGQRVCRCRIKVGMVGAFHGWTIGMTRGGG